MKKLLLLVLINCIAFFTYAQTEQVRKVDAFTAVSVGIAADVKITKGNQYGVVLKGDEDDLNEIETEVDGDRLKIKYEDDHFSSRNSFNNKIQVFITMPELTGISLAGSGSVMSEDNFRTGEFTADVAGSGKIELSIDAEETDINISGSGKILMKGSSTEADINISGSGDVEGEDFKVAECEINIMGSGDCTIHVTEKLETKVMGSGNVSYKGDPKHVNNNSMGSGRVRKF